MDKFDKSLNQLNQQQRRAVDQIDGPVMVIAGPGTGKTQLLSMRVANILRKTDTDPGSILCLTFTNKAALNMRQRIIELTGGEAKAINVKTFHSFAVEIMNIYPEYFWNGAQLITAPEASQLEIITTILKKLPLDNPLSLKFAGKFTSDKKVKDALKLVKEAGLTPDQLRSIIEANLAYIDLIEDQLCQILDSPLSFKKLDQLQNQIDQLPEQGISDDLLPLQDLGKVIKSAFAHSIEQDKQTGKTKHTGKLKNNLRSKVEGKSIMLKQRKANDWWLKLADVYEQYRRQLHSRGYYDHSDMIIEVITALRKHPELKAIAQEQYHYVLIDEFQDSNSAQLQLAHLIADSPSSNGNPNLMVVGDDDQTIYKFNGADLNNMLSFEKAYPSTKKIVLTKNYRSSQKIIDASEKIISNAEDRLVNRDPDINKQLTSQASIASSTVESWVYSTQEQQHYSLAQDIKQFLADNKSSDQKTVAILARGHQSLKLMASALDNQKIPINYELQNNIFDQEVVQLIHKIAGLLSSINSGDKQATNLLLSEVISHPAWGLSPESLWRLAIDNRRKSDWLDSLIRRPGNSKDSLSCQAIGKWLLALAAESKHQPLPVTMEYIIGMRPLGDFQSPIREYYLSSQAPDTNYLKALSAINNIYSLTKEFSKLHTPKLADFVNYINTSLENNIVVSDDLIYNSGSTSSSKQVELLTVHKAKGLEFDRVYIIDTLDNIWKPKSTSTYTPMNLPLQPVFDDQDDYARLMYVAATRAKQDLIFTSYINDQNNKEVLTTPLIYDVTSPNNKADQPTENTTAVMESYLRWPELNNKSKENLLKPLVENYGLSASALLSFLDLSYGGPKSFVENYLLRLPQPQTEAEAFGSAIHKALEIAQLQINSGGLDKQIAIAEFTKNLEQQYLPAEQYQRYQEKGKNLLNKLLESDYQLPKGGRPELNFDNINISGATIKGKIDNLHLEEKQATIIDYKTGSPLSSLETKDQSKLIKAWRHKTQLTFYALLVNNSNLVKKETSIIGQMHYLEAEKTSDIVRQYQPSDQDREHLAKLASIVWKKIVNLDFPDTSNYPEDFSGITQFQQDLLDSKI